MSIRCMRLSLSSRTCKPQPYRSLVLPLTASSFTLTSLTKRILEHAVHSESASKCRTFPSRRSRSTYPCSTALCGLSFSAFPAWAFCIILPTACHRFLFLCHLFPYCATRRPWIHSPDVGLLNTLDLRVTGCSRLLNTLR
jgi:hypothetical protein